MIVETICELRHDLMRSSRSNSEPRYREVSKPCTTMSVPPRTVRIGPQVLLGKDGPLERVRGNGPPVEHCKARDQHQNEHTGDTQGPTLQDQEHVEPAKSPHAPIAAMMITVTMFSLTWRVDSEPTQQEGGKDVDVEADRDRVSEHQGEIGRPLVTCGRSEIVPAATAARRGEY